MYFYLNKFVTFFFPFFPFHFVATGFPAVNKDVQSTRSRWIGAHVVRRNNMRSGANYIVSWRRDCLHGCCCWRRRFILTSEMRFWLRCRPLVAQMTISGTIRARRNGERAKTAAPPSAGVRRTNARIYYRPPVRMMGIWLKSRHLLLYYTRPRFCPNPSRIMRLSCRYPRDARLRRVGE